MLDIDSKVIGFFAYTPSTDTICDGDACIIAGSETTMKSYIASILPKNTTKTIIKKTRFIEIVQGMSKGGHYAFDEDSYNRFYPLANKRGFNLQEEDFSVLNASGKHFVSVKNKHEFNQLSTTPLNTG